MAREPRMDIRPAGARPWRELLAHFTIRLVPAYALLTLLFAAPSIAQAPPAATPAEPPPRRQLSLENKPWFGDFDSLRTKRLIRVLVPYSRTLYFVDKGRERGLTADLARDFEAYLNRKYAKQLKKRPITVILIPTTRDKLLSGVVEGHGDIAAGNLTETAERRKLVDFIAPADHKPMRELLVTGPAAPPIATLEDLSGKVVHVRTSTSYYESVKELNDRLRAEGRAQVVIVDLPPALEDEDVLEMVNAGLIGMTVVDDWKARMWKQVLPKLRLRDSLVLRSEGYPGWAVRKDSPKLVAVATEFYKYAKKVSSRETRLAMYHKRIKQISNNTSGSEYKRFEATLKLFEKYGARYHFDPLMLAAQGYQESRLRQDARSHVGAIGVMQIMPATGKELKVGDIKRIEPNIHGGTKYMNQLMTRYFPDANFNDTDRTLFAFASYNAGPGRIAKLRGRAIKRGLDGDKWFNNVELVVAESVGIETTTYVRNIYKYYVAYKLVAAQQAEAQKAKQEVKGTSP